MNCLSEKRKTPGNERPTPGIAGVGPSLQLFLTLHNFLRLLRTILRSRRNLNIVRSLDPQLLTQFRIDARERVLVLLQVAANIFTALPNALALVAVSRARLVDDIVQNREVQHIAFARDSLAVKNVELGIAEWRRHFILDDLDLGARADDNIAFLHCTNTPNINTYR